MVPRLRPCLGRSAEQTINTFSNSQRIVSLRTDPDWSLPKGKVKGINLFARLNKSIELLGNIPRNHQQYFH